MYSRKKHCWQHPGNAGQRSLLKEDQEGDFHATDQSSQRQVGGTCRWKSTLPESASAGALLL